MKKVYCLVLCLLCLGALSAQKFEGLAARPPMGWNSWNSFGTNINEDLIKQTADALVSSGMRDAGYEYLVLDDGWMSMERDSAGNLVPDPKKFPSGLQKLVEYVHDRGLKFGMYNCAGTLTCAKFPGTRGYEYQDARNYAAWDIDYLKFDWCNTAGINAREVYTTMSKALHKAGRPMIFSICEWGVNKPWEWAGAAGQLWRTTEDIYQVFDSVHNMGSWNALSVMRIADLNDSLRKYAGPGHWNDPDMLEVGNGMSYAEDRAHFSLWAMMAAPLMAGNDLRTMSRQTIEILKNKAVIAVDQDSLGIQGFKYAERDSLQIWFKPLQNGDWAVCFLNRSSTEQKVNFDWKKETVSDALYPHSLDKNHIYRLINLWTGKEEGGTSRSLTSSLASHDVMLFRLKK
jgi:alpha-galactosidase